MCLYIVESKAPPPGAVAVLPAGAVPLLNATKEGEILCTSVMDVHFAHSIHTIQYLIHVQ